MSFFSEKTPEVRTQAVQDVVLQTANVLLHVRREDELHEQVSGNKYRKLKYNLLAAKAQGFTKLLTFGGAYSNHIAATAFAAREMGFECIGVIRGEEIAHKWQDNPTLCAAHEQGMQFHFVSRAAYRKKHEPDVVTALKQQFGACYVIPEGGTNSLAVKGCEEILTTDDLTQYDVVCCAVGTGGTLAGLINATQDSGMKVIGFAAVNAPSLQQDIETLVKSDTKHWQLNFDYTFGGYAKTTSVLIEFINDFKEKNGIKLEPIYTGKMLYGIYELVQKGYFKQGSRILAIHTGGLQGLNAQ